MVFLRGSDAVASSIMMELDCPEWDILEYASVSLDVLQAKPMKTVKV